MFTKVILLVVSILIISCLGAEKYTTKYDNIDWNEIIHSERLLKNYIHCLDNTGPCTPDGKELKENLPDALETDCSKCSEKQKSASEKVVHHLIDNKPDDWARLEEIYDPTGQYRKKYLSKKNGKE